MTRVSSDRYAFFWFRRDPYGSAKSALLLPRNASCFGQSSVMRVSKSPYVRNVAGGAFVPGSRQDGTLRSVGRGGQGLLRSMERARRYRLGDRLRRDPPWTEVPDGIRRRPSCDSM